MKIIYVIGILLALSGCHEIISEDNVYLSPLPQPVMPTHKAEEPQRPPLTIKNINTEIFYTSIDNPRIYDIPGYIRAGVIPHHTTAATLISGFFSRVSEHAEQYDTVFILAPHHQGDIADIIVTDRDWKNGVVNDLVFTEKLLAAKGFNIIIHNERMEDDHSASVLIPYVQHYLPDKKVVTVLISRSLGFDGSQNFARLITRLAEELEREVLWICSIDFSHFLTSKEAMENNQITKEAILEKDYWRIHQFNNFYLDSPNAMNIFLRILDSYRLEPQIIDEAEASEFMGYAIDETTSYMVIVGISD